jgi:amidophosphoribosyltransferase
MDSKQSPSDDAEQREPNPGSLFPEISDLEGDTLREECGVFGIFGHPEAAAITALGLHALQHRGQEAAGIVSFDGTRFHSERRLGLVGDTFSRREVIERLPGNAAIGHVRYSTTGETILRNVQPLFAELNAGGFAVGHNGNLTNGLTIYHRYRSHPASGRPIQAQPLHRSLRRGAARDRRRLLARLPDQQEADRRP